MVRLIKEEAFQGLVFPD